MVQLLKNFCPMNISNSLLNDQKIIIYALFFELNHKLLQNDQLIQRLID